ncbi:MAG: universal stress protein [Deltaproteobacteria bacterium]|nr:universal stress protein [Deltaproteobacteria bacterium]
MFTKILLPTDFSECSTKAARVARRVAERFNARIVVLHVLDEPVALDPMFRGDVPVELLRTRMEQFAQENMDAFLAAHFSGFENFDTMLASGIPYREIIKKARETGADLIVIGTHGRTGVEHVLFGSTAEKVVRMGPCPVLTVRPGNTEFIRP